MSALYIHIPFCEKKCFYCSFVVSIAQENRMDSYLESVRQELMRYQAKPAGSVYIGGGTPSMLPEAGLEKLIGMIKNYGVHSGAEWTIELNPESVDRKKIKLLKDGGVNRFSLGIQTFNERYLKYLGRNHSSNRARAAIEDLRREGIENISLDLIFGFPEQTMEELQRDLDEIITAGCLHVSLYALTVEAPSRFHAQRVRLDDERQGQQYSVIVEALSSAGFMQYEVSNFSLPGRESAHNMNYWMGGNYLGVGIGAHSHHDGVRRWNIPQLTEYIKRIQDGEDVTEGSERLSLSMRFSEALIFGLRMNRGLDIHQLEEKFYYRLDDHRRKTLALLIDSGMLVREGNWIKATSKGRLVLDEISARLI